MSKSKRAIALAVLLFSFAILTGLATTVSALGQPERADACCDWGQTDPEPLAGPCAAADCLCFSCLAIDLTNPLPLPRQLPGATITFFPPAPLCPDGFSAAIDYPPETA